MENVIQTTGGVLHPQNIEFINNSICEVFNCEPSQITELQPLQKGLSNSVLSFRYFNYHDVNDMDYEEHKL